MIKDYISYLLSLESKGIKLGLESTEQLLEACSNPHRNFKSIQVIGTNGKGSTSAMIANILKEAGYIVGLYTSPHLNKINERIRVNGQAISDNDIIKFIDHYQKSIDSLNTSFFETITAIAAWYFARKKVDIAILETGLGGRLDSVTACNADLLVCTSISKDHQHILGDSLEEIAYEKICALKKGMTCISWNHTSSIKDIFKEYSQSINAKIKYVKSNIDKKNVSLNGAHQFDNETLAKAAIKELVDFNISITDIKKGLSTVIWPGRIQKINVNPNVYFDVAHNEESFKSLCNFSNKINGKKILILALQKNKNIKSVISEIKSTFDVIIITQTNVRNFMPSLELSALFDSNKVKVIINTQKAIRNYKKIKKSDNIIIAGSHYLGTEISKEFKISFDNI